MRGSARVRNVRTVRLVVRPVVDGVLDASFIESVWRADGFSTAPLTHSGAAGRAPSLSSAKVTCARLAIESWRTDRGHPAKTATAQVGTPGLRPGRTTH